MDDVNRFGHREFLLSAAYSARPGACKRSIAQRGRKRKNRRSQGRRWYRVLRKIYEELKMIRKEVQNIRKMEERATYERDLRNELKRHELHVEWPIENYIPRKGA